MWALSWRAVLVVVVAVTTSVLAAVPGSGESTPAVRSEVATNAPAPTRVLRTSPVDAAGALRPGYRVVIRARGSCFTTSTVHGRAFRCFRGNLIQDPCWRQPGSRVACLIRPWSTRVTQLGLTSPLPRTQPG